MPTDVKAIVSAVVMLVALGLVYWHGSPVRPDFGKAVLAIAVFFVVAMWILPHARVNKCGVNNRYGVIPKSGYRFPALAKPASAGEGWSEKIMHRKNVRDSSDSV
jgi:hypothetical protein